ncbi:OmpA family protein [Solirubrobacter sp. CPCC 204708]|uniref:OmpA family protein n=1 Tax=Solirubrobacter deserti TaxID=2282478 RepID=A0ABT4RRU3_9ACTN|nr:OmpA family protein [Solirubrobacter deserti]MBE2317575.1 OmpA family protein [Solirubrobacter deserti]MDA0141269.1 OmpA family protein [Solirubrobacter deserti]
MAPTRLAAIALATGASLVGASSAHAAVANSHTNGIYTVQVNSNGQFGAVTGANHPDGAGKYLTYGGYGARNLVHSYTTDADYVLAAQASSPYAVTVSAIPNGVRQSFAVTGADSLGVEQDAVVTGTTAADSSVTFTLRLTNTGGSPLKLGARTTIDFLLNTDDGPVFTPAGGSAVGTGGARFLDPTFPTFTLEDNDQGAPTLRASWTANLPGGISPDMLDVADYGSAPATPFIPVLAGATLDSDNEVRWTWGRDLAHALTLDPGEVRELAIKSTLASAAAPVNTVAPSVAGTAEVGHTLTGTPGTWTAPPLTSYGYAWLRCDGAGANCSPIAGANALTYTATAGDLGSTLRLRETAAGVDADSAATAVVSAAPTPTPTPTPPAPTPTPEPPAPTPTPTPEPPAPTPTATPEPPAPVVTPTPVAPPKFTVSVGDAGDTAKTATVAASAGGVDVGCKVTGTVLKSCKVDLYAEARRGVATAASVVLIGTGTAAPDKATGALEVRVELNATGRALLRRSPRGLAIQVKITGRPSTGAAFEATRSARLVPGDTSSVAARFAIDSAKLTAATKRSLATLAQQAKGAKRVTCVGHTEPSLSGARYDRKLGIERAKVVCAFLKTRGVKATFKTASKGATAPAASNATPMGRALNRRVVVQLVR